MLNCVVRISSHGDLLGTGSIISVPSETIPGLRWPYIVTADHVIHNEDGIELEVPNPRRNGELSQPIPSAPFVPASDAVDLAIAPFPADQVERYQETRLEHFIPEGHVAPLGGEIFYLGMFAPADVPMARAGTLGNIDIPRESETKGKRYSYQGDFVDCRSYAGFSGSPCFALMYFAALNMPGNVPDDFLPERADGSRPELVQVAVVANFCGIFVAHFDDPPLGRDVESKYGVGVMLPCDYVRDALMTDDAIAERQKADAEWKQRKAAEGPQMQNVGAAEGEGNGESEWDRFEALTRQLVQTPKPPASE
jgi:hypothetical protein